MSTSISTAFIKQFESEVHMAYQRMGSKLRNTVRQVNNVKGSQARFQKSVLVLLCLNQDMHKFQLWISLTQLLMLLFQTSMRQIMLTD